MFQDKPAHHLFGYPSPGGNDMDLECQLVSNGLYCGNASGYNNPQAKQLRAGRSDWILLLQLDTDDDAGMMWETVAGSTFGSKRLISQKHVSKTVG